MTGSRVVVSPGTLEGRRRRGLDLLDEVWEGEYHVVPSPSWDHQTIAVHLAAFLDRHCARHRLGRASAGVNVREPGTGSRNYRVPDVVYVSRRRSHVIRGQWVEGAPDAVVEIRSPGDDTYEKFPFYSMLGVPTLVLLNGRRAHVEVYRLECGRYEPVKPDLRGRFPIDRLRVSLRPTRRRGKPAVEVASAMEDGASLVV